MPQGMISRYYCNGKYLRMFLIYLFPYLYESYHGTRWNSLDPLSPKIWNVQSFYLVSTGVCMCLSCCVVYLQVVLCYYKTNWEVYYSRSKNVRDMFVLHHWFNLDILQTDS